MNSPIVKFCTSPRTLIALSCLLVLTSLGLLKAAQIQDQQCKAQIDKDLQTLEARTDSTSIKLTRLTQKIKTLKANGQWTSDTLNAARQESDALQKERLFIKSEINRIERKISSHCR